MTSSGNEAKNLEKSEKSQNLEIEIPRKICGNLVHLVELKIIGKIFRTWPKMNSLSVTSGGGQGKTTTLGQTEAKMEAMDNTLDSLTASVTQMENACVKLQTGIVKLMGVKGRLF